VRLALILILLLVSRVAHAGEVQTIPPGDDVIVVVHKGDPAPFTGQLFDNATSVRWALWLQQYKQLLDLHDAHAKAVCQADLDHERALQAIDAQQAQTVRDDLKKRLGESEQRRAELENPSWYQSPIFYFAVGAVTAVGLGVLGAHVLH
jgi:hypothetical protein